MSGDAAAVSIHVYDMTMAALVCLNPLVILHFGRLASRGCCGVHRDGDNLHPTYQLPQCCRLLLLLWSCCCRDAGRCTHDSAVLRLTREVVQYVRRVRRSAAQDALHQVLLLHTAGRVLWMHDAEGVVVLRYGVAARTARVCQTTATQAECGARE